MDEDGYIKRRKRNLQTLVILPKLYFLNPNRSLLPRWRGVECLYI